MKKLLFFFTLLPSIAFADRLGSLRSNADVFLTTQTLSISNIRLGPVTVVHSSGTWDVYNSTAETPEAYGAALLRSQFSWSDGASVYLTNAVFNIGGNPINLALSGRSIDLVGQGPGTLIRTAAVDMIGVIPGSTSTIKNLQISMESSDSYCIRDNAVLSTVTISGVICRALGSVGVGIYKTNQGIFNIDHSQFDTNSHGIFQEAGTINFTDSYTRAGEIAHYAFNGEANYYSGSISGVTEDIHFDGGTVNVGAGFIYDSSKTNGTPTYLSTRRPVAFSSATVSVFKTDLYANESIVVTHQDGDKTVYHCTTDSDCGTVLAGITILDGDVINLGPRTFDVGTGRINLNTVDHASLVGSGRDLTMLTFSGTGYCIKPSSFCYIANLSFKTDGDPVLAGIGNTGGSAAGTQLVIENIDGYAQPDAIALNSNFNVDIFNSILRSGFDVIANSLPSGSTATINVYNSQLLSYGGSINAHGFECFGGGIINSFNNIVDVRDATNRGGYDNAGTCTYNIYGGKVETYDGGLDFSGGNVFVDPSVIYSSTKTSGSVSFLSKNRSVQYSSATVGYLSVNNANTNLTVNVGTLPVNSGFGPQTATDILWNRANITQAGFYLVNSTLPFNIGSNGRPTIAGEGTGMFINNGGVSFSSYSTLTPAGTLFSTLGSDGLYLFNQAIFNFQDPISFNSFSLQASSSMTENALVVLPSTAGATGDVMTLSGHNTLSWNKPSSGGSSSGGGPTIPSTFTWTLPHGIVASSGTFTSTLTANTYAYVGSSLTVGALDLISLGNISNVVITTNTGSGNFDDNNFVVFLFSLYAFKSGVWSATSYPITYEEVGSFGQYYLTFTWPAVAGATKYRLVIEQDDYDGYYGDFYLETAANSISYGDGTEFTAVNCGGACSQTPTSPYLVFSTVSVVYGGQNVYGTQYVGNDLYVTRQQSVGSNSFDSKLSVVPSTDTSPGSISAWDSRFFSVGGPGADGARYGVSYSTRETHHSNIKPGVEWIGEKHYASHYINGNPNTPQSNLSSYSSGTFLGSTPNYTIALATWSQVSIGTTPVRGGGNLVFNGDTGSTIEVTTTTSLNGKHLTIRAGGAQSATSNRTGGDLILMGGNATGNGTSAIKFFTAGNGASGTNYSTATEKASIRPNGGFWFGSGAGTGFVNSSINAGIDISYGGSPAGLVLGAENNLTTRTNNTPKNGRIGIAPYSSSQMLMTCLIGNTGSSSNTLAWGGGTSIAQAATQQDFYTGPYNTASPPSRLTINSTGDVIVTTGTFRVGTNTNAVVLSSTGYVSALGPFTVAGGSVTVTGLTQLSTTTFTGGARLFSRTIAQLNSMTPSAAAIQYYCSDCTQQAICISTGTGTGAFASPSDKTVHCN